MSGSLKLLRHPRHRCDEALAAFANEPRLARGLIGLTAVMAVFILARTTPELWPVLTHRPLTFVEFALVAVALASTPVQVYGRGSFTFAGAGLLATAFTLGTAATMLVAFLVAAVILIRNKGLLHRAIFNGVVLALAAAGGGADRKSVV